MEGTDYFQAKRQRFQPMNFIWKENEKLKREANIAADHVVEEVRNGILLKYEALRLQELDRIISKNCFKNKEYNYLQARKCEEYHMENDYKLGLINRFIMDHIWKYT